ncbi:FBD-associated F-box protein At3g52670-like [Panicum virgatum]|uniref:FBD-associated F-box protein At3g52670-like n=1 Tax=Panicum virgatum TaxID=38727 RepID=UPI0019D6638F|nr:FBD-associated F-box protein At3g52670-like [Panicum virgatum]
MEIKFEDLPEDIQCTILSKLPLKELVRTSILSSEWRYLWVSRISCLQSIQLSFVSLKPPFQFGGFPNLRKLDLSMVHVTGKDLEDTLSSCCNIECLSLDRSHLGVELKMDTPVPSATSTYSCESDRVL